MKYTKKQRQAIAEVFTKAHKKMQRNPPWGANYNSRHNSRYICDNVGGVLGGSDREHAAYDVINERIKGRFCVEYWLRDEGHISTDFADAARYGDRNTFECKQMHKYRLRWLKSLIAEFSAKEKQA